MFDNCNLLALMQEKEDTGKKKIVKISLDRETQKAICNLFESNAHALITCADGTPKTMQKFEAGYMAQREADEYLAISDFKLPDEMISAIKAPLPLETYKPHADSLPQIRALFVGVETSGGITAAFQRFKAAQYLRASSVHLLFDNDTLSAGNGYGWRRSKAKVGITVQPVVDAVFSNGTLMFVSSYYAKQIFDLTDYYKEATNPEIVTFLSLPILRVNSQAVTADVMNTWERRKIASIMSQKILEEHPIEELQGAAEELDYELPTEDGKLIMPDDRKGRRELLSFLDEDVYRGMLTGSVYETNSKKSAKPSL